MQVSKSEKECKVKGEGNFLFLGTMFVLSLDYIFTCF